VIVIIPLLIMSVLAGVVIGVFIWTQIRSELSTPEGAAEPKERVPTEHP
jgi:DMSO reductase anchor subunit